MEIIWRFMKTFILFWSDLIHIFIELLHFLLIVIISGSIIVTMAPTVTATLKLQYLPSGQSGNTSDLAPRKGGKQGDTNMTLRWSSVRFRSPLA